MTLRIEDFEGSWTLSRCIEDHRAGATGRLEGEAQVASGQGGHVYIESGTLRLPGQPPLAAERRYLWRPAPGGVAVHFDDGRFFHLMALDAPHATADHDCDPDRYEVRYDFSAWPQWRAVWEVRGPRKDYRLESLYRR